MSQPYPRIPTTDEFADLSQLIINTQYPAGDACKQERSDLISVLAFAVSDGKFIVTNASSDSPGFCGLMAFMIWPDTSVTMYRKGTGSTSEGMKTHDRHGNTIHMDAWYECDKDGVPWL
jgi:hypothetical protein